MGRTRPRMAFMFGRIAAALASGHYVVRGLSMRPAFEPGQRLLVSRERGADPARGDAVIVRDPRGSGARYLKRVVGLPGEQVRIEDGLLHVDGERIEEPYLEGLPASVGPGGTAWTLGPDEYLVMGDDRVRSTDSREFGALSRELVLGRVWFRYWPLSAWGRVG